MRRRLKTIGNRRGASAVEFAIVAPVFIVFLFGTIELGRLALARNVLANASREGARYAILEGATVEDVIDIATDFATACSVPGVSVTVTPNDLDGPESLITVTVSIGFNDISYLPTPWFVKNGTLSSSTTMRKETFDSTTM